MLSANYQFMPVGQGLFATGSFGLDGCVQPRFRWVYDCGTASGLHLIESGIEQLKDEIPKPQTEKRVLDLVVISHFDADHLNGLKHLLIQFHIKNLMLPFTYLGQRLQYMFSQRPYTSKADQAYYLDPVETILAIEGVKIDSIILVLPATGDPVPVQAPPLEPTSPRQFGSLLFEQGFIPNNDLIGNTEISAMRNMTIKNKVSLQVMSGNSAATYNEIWEFIPYNEPYSTSKASVDFLKKVEAKRQILFSSTSVEKTHAIKSLKKTYDEHFGSSGKDRNIISLFLYSGPVNRIDITPSDITCLLVDTAPWEKKECMKDRLLLSVLYTGDGYINKIRRWNELVHYFGELRMSRIAALQVMHHGARGNWFKGLANLICPALSIFSSDPDRGGKPEKSHPHAKVLEDFRSHCPLQADKKNSVEFQIRYHCSCAVFKRCMRY